MAKQVQAAIAQLKPIQRERLIKYFFEGKTLLQIAAEEGKSYSTVYESYQTALKKLKKYLKIKKCSITLMKLCIRQLESTLKIFAINTPPVHILSKRLQ